MHGAGDGNWVFKLNPTFIISKMQNLNIHRKLVEDFFIPWIRGDRGGRRGPGGTGSGRAGPVAGQLYLKK
jgi:hypothetical protein